MTKLNIKKTALSLALSAGLIITTNVSAAEKIVNIKHWHSSFNHNLLIEQFKEFCDNIQLPEQNENNQNSEVNSPEAETPDTENQKPEISADEFELKVLELVNIERAKHNLAPLSWDSSLAEVAKAHSFDMAKNNYFSHTNLNGQSAFDRMKNAGINYSYAAENIAAGQKTPESAMNSWMNSEGHRNNILNKNVTRIGVGYVKGGSYGHYWTQNFAG